MYRNALYGAQSVWRRRNGAQPPGPARDGTAGGGRRREVRRLQKTDISSYRRQRNRRTTWLSGVWRISFLACLGELESPEKTVAGDGWGERELYALCRPMVCVCPIDRAAYRRYCPFTRGVVSHSRLATGTGLRTCVLFSDQSQVQSVIGLKTPTDLAKTRGYGTAYRPRKYPGNDHMLTYRRRWCGPAS
ncbi:hypothetical protein TNCV_2079401 [Trichonephila clavipes]|nr:hypothetical protein TNCV_2079401 [Trichonephila clavipes]